MIDYKSEVAKIRRENAKSVIKKLIAGSVIILMVGIAAYALLFLAMAIM